MEPMFWLVLAVHVTPWWLVAAEAVAITVATVAIWRL